MRGRDRIRKSRVKKYGFDAETTEFLNAQKNPSTRHTYNCALEAFQNFYASQGTIRDFLLPVEADEKTPSFLEQKRVALNTINDFVTAMKKNTEYKAKTTRTYAGAVQALVKYLIPGAKVSTRYADFSGSRETRRQYPWTVQTVSMFADAMNYPLYRCLVVVFFQSGITIRDVLMLTYGDVKKEFEAETMPLCLDLGRIKKDAPYMTFMGSLSFLLLKQYLSCRGALSMKDPLFAINKSSVERIFLRRAKKHPRVFDHSYLYGPQSLRVGFRTAMQDSGLKQQSLGFFMGTSQFSTRRFYKSKSKDEWRAEYAKHESAVTFQLPSQTLKGGV